MHHSFLLVSSNGSKSGAIGKSFVPLDNQSSEITKADCLTLDLDIVNLQNLYKEKKWRQLEICESTMHKKDSLKTKDQILSKIKQYYVKTTQGLRFFYFTGHGYANGDLCIETKENPDGERLKIEQILDIILVQQNKNKLKCLQNGLIWIFLDSCYSGRNAERAKQYLLKRKYWGNLVMCCSSGPQYESIVTPVGSLLIASICKNYNSRIKENKEKLAEQFKSKKPIVLYYHGFKISSLIENLQF